METSSSNYKDSEKGELPSHISEIKLSENLNIFPKRPYRGIEIKNYSRYLYMKIMNADRNLLKHVSNICLGSQK